MGLIQIPVHQEEKDKIQTQIQALLEEKGMIQTLTQAHLLENDAIPIRVLQEEAESSLTLEDVTIRILT